MSISTELKGMWRVSSPCTAPITVRSTDWISALGRALHQLGRADHIDRMACERLGHGEFIINDLTHDCRYIVQQLASAADLPEVQVADEEVTEVGLHRPVPPAAIRVSSLPADEDNGALAMGDATERTDPFSGWGMSLEIEHSEDLPSEERPIIESYRTEASMNSASQYEDAFAFDADDIDEEFGEQLFGEDDSDDEASEEALPDMSTLVGWESRGQFAAALEKIRLRRVNAAKVRQESARIELDEYR